MTIESRLAEIRARVEAATEGPWSVYRGDRIGTYVTRPDLAGVAREWSLTWSDADAEFIAHSRTDLPALLAAVEAVRALHQPMPIYDDECADTDCDRDHVELTMGEYWHTDSVAGQSCRECAGEDFMPELRDWPCPTITTLTAALEAEG